MKWEKLLESVHETECGIDYLLVIHVSSSDCKYVVRVKSIIR